MSKAATTADATAPSWWDALRSRLLPRKSARQSIVVVSGLPRSGTSMMMRMLEAGGIEPFTDDLRRADDDNPKGYYEFEKIKGLPKEPDKSWLAGARGKALKAISYLLKDLPGDFSYEVIFLRRNLREVLASQNKMLVRRGEKPGDADADEKMLGLYEKHLREVHSWLSRQPNFRILEVAHREVIDSPLAQAERVREFLLRKDLDVQAMADAVDPALYRNRFGAGR